GRRAAENERLVRRSLGSLVPISQPIHEVSADTIEIVRSKGWWRLWHAIAPRNVVNTRCVGEASHDCCTRLHSDRWSWIPCYCHSERVSKVGKGPVWGEEKLCLARSRRSQTVEISR